MKYALLKRVVCVSLACVMFVTTFVYHDCLGVYASDVYEGETISEPVYNELSEEPSNPDEESGDLEESLNEADGSSSVLNESSSVPNEDSSAPDEDSSAPDEDSSAPDEESSAPDDGTGLPESSGLPEETSAPEVKEANVVFSFAEGSQYIDPAQYTEEQKDAILLHGVSAVDENEESLTSYWIQDYGDFTIENPNSEKAYTITYAATHPVTKQVFTATRDVYVIAAIQSKEYAVGAWDDLQAAVTDAPSGSTIKITQGFTFGALLEINDKTLSFTANKQVILKPAAKKRHIALSMGSNITFDKNIILNGDTSATGVNQGGVSVNDATLNGAVIRNCKAEKGGGIIAGGTVLINDCEIKDNRSTSYGGGIYATGPLTVDNSTVTNNIGIESGGGIYALNMKVTITGCIISSNSAPNGLGGGIYKTKNEMEIIDSEISDNTSFYRGGGIFTSAQNLTITRSRISGNHTTGNPPGLSPDGGQYCGGGIAHWVSISPCTIVIEDSIIEGNSTYHNGAGIYSAYPSTKIEVKGHSEINNNTAGYYGGGIYYGGNVGGVIANLGNLTVGADVNFEGNEAMNARWIELPDPDGQDTSADIAAHGLSISTNSRSAPPAGNHPFTSLYNNYDVGYKKGATEWPLDAETFTVKFESNGGTPVNDLTNITSGSTITRPSPNPTKEYYEFLYWYKDPALTQRWNFNTDTVTANITLYARWEWTGEIVPIDTNPVSDFSTASIIQPHIATFGIPLAAPMPANDPPISENAINVGYRGSTALTYAEFSFPKKGAGINPNNPSDKGTGSVYRATGVGAPYYNDPDYRIVVPATFVAIEGGFGFWKIEVPEDADMTPGGIIGARGIVIDEEFGEENVYFAWVTAATEEMTVIVTFNALGGTMTSPSNVMLKIGDKITKPNDPTKSGYTFDGWHKNYNPTTEVCTNPWNFDDTINSGITLYAKWIKNNALTTQNIKFGTHPLPVVANTILGRNGTGNPTGPMSITVVSASQSWKLGVAYDTPLTYTLDSNYKLPNTALIFRDNGKTDSQAITITSSTIPVTDTLSGDQTLSWSADYGVLVKVGPGDIQKTGEYQATLTWSILNIP